MGRQEFKRLEGIEAEKAIAKERSENWVAPRATAECPVPVIGTPAWALLSDVLFNPDASREMQEALDFG